MTELHWWVRVQEAFMAAVLIGPTTKTTTTTTTTIKKRDNVMDTAIVKAETSKWEQVVVYLEGKQDSLQKT
jgi:hypothetical protein